MRNSRPITVRVFCGEGTEFLNTLMNFCIHKVKRCLVTPAVISEPPFMTTMDFRNILRLPPDETSGATPLPHE
jgi:hypothetical protein